MTSVVRHQWLGLSLAVGLGFGAQPGPALDLDLADIEVENGGKIDFEEASCEPIDSLPFPARGDDDVNRVALPHYNVYFRIEDIVPRKAFGFIRYRFYVVQRSGGGGMSECVVPGKPYGSFRPQLADVTLYVEDDRGGKESATIHLPIFSLVSQAYLAVPTWKEPEKVEIGGETEIAVQLENLLKEWPVRVDAVSQPSLRGIWRRADFLAKGQKEFAPFDVPTGVSMDKLVLRLVPNSGRALLKSLFSRSSQGDPEKIMASLEYRVRLGLRDNLEKETLQIEIPVRFVPWPPLLFLALAVGTLLGSLIPWATATGQGRTVDWLHALAASGLTALLAWLIAIFLVQHDSEFRLLGFTLDPFQFLPTALIGAMMGLLGFKSLETVKRLIPSFGKEAAAGRGAAGEKE